MDPAIDRRSRITLDRRATALGGPVIGSRDERFTASYELPLSRKRPVAGEPGSVVGRHVARIVRQVASGVDHLVDGGIARSVGGVAETHNRRVVEECVADVAAWLTASDAVEGVDHGEGVALGASGCED